MADKPNFVLVPDPEPEAEEDQQQPVTLFEQGVLWLHPSPADCCVG